MISFYSNSHQAYRLSYDVSDGMPAVEHLDSPERLELMKERLSSLGIEVVEVLIQEQDRLDLIAHVKKIHTAQYVDFMVALSDSLNADEEILPMISHPLSVTKQVPLRFRIGSYCSEIGTPIKKSSLPAALDSYGLALQAADYIQSSQESALALTRPPGHHAGKSRYAGYCIFNQGMGAATYLSQDGPVAVLDIDYHIGDGCLDFTQPNITYYSIHAEPTLSYPYRSFEQSSYLNTRLFSFQANISIIEYLELLQTVISEIKDSKVKYLIVLTGFDLCRYEYVQDTPTQIEPDDFKHISALIKKVHIPTLFLIEGGYDLEHLGQCFDSFFGVYTSNP